MKLDQKTLLAKFNSLDCWFYMYAQNWKETTDPDAKVNYTCLAAREVGGAEVVADLSGDKALIARCAAMARTLSDMINRVTYGQ